MYHLSLLMYIFIEYCTVFSICGLVEYTVVSFNEACLPLGLKVMMVCFEKHLSQDWHRVLHCLRDMDIRNEGGLAFWDFLDFVVSFRTALFIQMRPFILKKVWFLLLFNYWYFCI